MVTVEFHVNARRHGQERSVEAKAMRKIWEKKIDASAVMILQEGRWSLIGICDVTGNSVDEIFVGCCFFRF